MIPHQNRINFVDKYNKAGITDYPQNNGKKHVSIDLSLHANTQRKQTSESKTAQSVKSDSGTNDS